MNTLNFVAVPVIVTIVYTLVSLLKKETKGNEKVLTRLPLIAAAIGAVLGVVGFYAAPSIVPADNIFTALLIGISSGLAATGTNQIFKQLGKKDEGDKDGNDNERGGN